LGYKADGEKKRVDHRLEEWYKVHSDLYWREKVLEERRRATATVSCCKRGEESPRPIYLSTVTKGASSGGGEISALARLTPVLHET